MDTWSGCDGQWTEPSPRVVVNCLVRLTDRPWIARIGREGGL